MFARCVQNGHSTRLDSGIDACSMVTAHSTRSCAGCNGPFQLQLCYFEDGMRLDAMIIATTCRRGCHIICPQRMRRCRGRMPKQGCMTMSLFAMKPAVCLTGNELAPKGIAGVTQSPSPDPVQTCTRSGHLKLAEPSSMLSQVPKAAASMSGHATLASDQHTTHL